MANKPAAHIRRANAEDAELIVTLNEHVQAVHAALLPNLFKPAGESTLTMSDVGTLLTKSETLALIATIEGEPVGYAYAEVRRRPETPYAFAHDEIYLHHISVAPDRRRCGVGTALIDTLEQFAANLGIVRLALDVWTVNEPARAFFRAHGFEQYNERLARGGWGTRRPGS